MNQTLKRLLTLSACLIASLALLAGCGDDDEAEDGGGRRYHRGLLGRDADRGYQGFNAAVATGAAETACSLLSPAGIKQVEQASIGGTCTDWVDEVQSVLTPDYKKSMENAQVNDEQIRGETATLEVQDPVLNCRSRSSSSRSTEPGSSRSCPRSSRAKRLTRRRRRKRGSGNRIIRNEKKRPSRLTSSGTASAT